MTDIEYIRDKLSQDELLAQLAEEAAELGHAALKLRRVYDGTNPTPVQRSEALDNLMEEIADVELVLIILRLDMGVHVSEYAKIATHKIHRWAERLKTAELVQTIQ